MNKNLVGSLVLSLYSLLRSTLVSAPNILVADLWPVSLLIGFVFHDLQPTIRQDHAVRALSIFVLSTFLLAKFAPRLGILDFVGELIVSWFLFSRQTQSLLIAASTESTKEHNYFYADMQYPSLFRSCTPSVL
jgi:hypothetical protein